MKERISPRLKHFDYSSPGAYFITIATESRKPVLANFHDGELELSGIGREVAKAWKSIPEIAVNAVPDSFAVMPDHFHGIILLNLPWLSGYNSSVRNDLRQVVSSFKQYTQRHAWRILEERNGQRVEFKLWQRRYYDRVMRDEQHLMNTRQYIMLNPLAWKLRKAGFVLQQLDGKPL
jgi:REP element-mobilizing transposase RayT